jgi:RNA polymerase sigma-70 factor (ECF subfamily)
MLAFDETTGRYRFTPGSSDFLCGRNAPVQTFNQQDMSSSPEPLQGRIIELLPRLRRFARTLTRNAHDADDLLQLALERALRHLQQWQSGTRLDSWLYGILKNAWIDELRSRGRREQVFADPEQMERVPDRSADASGTLSIQQAMEQLPEEQRLAVALVLIEGLSYKEAAQVMGVPMGTLTSRLARGREALQQLLPEGAT